MPFDFKKYDAKCAAMSPAELQLQWEHYTRLISGAATSTAVSGVAMPLTLGVSAVGVAMAAPAIHNARKKREIIEKHLNQHGVNPLTRKRDVLTSVAISGTVGVVTMGVSSMGADALSGHAAEYGIQSVVENELAVKVGTHVAFDAAAMAGEHAHTEHKKKKEAIKAHQEGRISAVYGTSADEKAGQAQMQGVPDGYYPAVPLPQSYSTVQSTDFGNTGYAQVNLNYAPPHAVGQSSSQEYPPPPQYPGPASNTSFPNATLEPSASIPPPKNASYPPLPNFGPDSKFNLMVVDQKLPEHGNSENLPVYIPPVGGPVSISEKVPQNIYQPSQPYPQQHYPPPPIESTTAPTYPSYPGAFIDRSQIPQPIQASNSVHVVQQEIANGLEVANLEGTSSKSIADTGQSVVSAAISSPPPPLAPAALADQRPGMTESQTAISQPQTSGTIYIPAPPPTRPPLMHQRSFPIAPTPAPSYHSRTNSFAYNPSQQTTPAPTYQQPFSSPPQQQNHTAGSGVPNQSFFPPPPPPPPPIGFPATPVHTPGAPYAQYNPAQYAATTYPTGYPTPAATPYSEYPVQPIQQYAPEKQTFPQYQEVPIPGPQILSQQGQYMNNQYQNTGYTTQQNMYGY